MVNQSAAVKKMVQRRLALKSELRQQSLGNEIAVRCLARNKRTQHIANRKVRALRSFATFVMSRYQTTMMLYRTNKVCANSAFGAYGKTSKRYLLIDTTRCQTGE